MTGIFVRVQVDGSWKNIEIEELSDEELADFIADKSQRESGWPWVSVLVKWIRNNVKEQS